VVLPTTAQDVSKAVLFAVEHKLELVVKGGGHALSASSSTDGGLVIDLGNMRAVTVDVAKKTVTAQGGALWSDVDEATHPHGLAAVGGTVNHTGVGGLTLGGGYGYLSPKVGLTIDNLLEVEYVLADGKVVRASEKEHTDLFWAARGAGAAFGVATEFVYQAHDQKSEVWGGLVVFEIGKFEEVIRFANGLLVEVQEKAIMLVALAVCSPMMKTSGMLTRVGSTSCIADCCSGISILQWNRRGGESFLRASA
jgi:FAD/FMN-containing dehydrogenase